MKSLTVLLVLGACATATPPPEPDSSALPPVPETIATCPLGGRIPPPMPAVRTVEMLLAYTMAMQHLALQNERARAICAREYEKLRNWLDRANLI